MKQLAQALLVFCVLLFAVSCKKPAVNNEPKGSGLFIVNEGNFGFGNAEVAFYDDEKKQLSDGLFQSTNGYAIGDVAQSMTLHDSTGFIVVNNSAKVEVVHLPSLQVWRSIFITGSSPRYVLPVNDSIAYVTELYANKIWLVNYASGAVVGNIAVNGWTEHLAMSNGFAFVTLRAKPLTTDTVRQLLIINTQTHQVSNSIELPSEPNSLVQEANGNLWVLCERDSAHGVKASLQHIDVVAQQIDKAIEFPSLADSPRNLCLNKTSGTLYWLNDDVQQMSANDTVFSATEFSARANRLLYALGADAVSGDVYVSDALDYLQPSRVYRYSTTGALLDEFSAGIISTQFVFYHE